MPEFVLFHGTTTRRLKEIHRENRLRAQTMGRVSLTTERTVAEYFAYNCVYGERRRLPGEDIEAALIEIDAEALREHEYRFGPVTDPIWGAGHCDWEREIACYGDIYPLGLVLVGLELLPLTNDPGAMCTRLRVRAGGGPQIPIGPA